MIGVRKGYRISFDAKYLSLSFLIYVINIVGRLKNKDDGITK